MGLRAFVDQLHVRLAQRGYADLRPTFGFVLNAVRDGGATAVGIAELLGVTKQAASKTVDSMEAAGLVRRAPNADDGRSKLVVLTSRGEDFLRTAEAIYAELEDEWASIIGRTQVEGMRADLERVLLVTHDDTLPPLRPTW